MYATHSPTPPPPAARTYRQVDDLTTTMERQNAAKDGQLSALREEMEATSWAHSTKRAEVEARAAATADEVARLRGEVQRLEDERAGLEAAAAAEKTRLMLKMEDELRAMHAKEHSDDDAATKRALEAQLGQARLSQKVDATLAELRHVTTAKERMEAVLESRLRDYEEASRRAALQVGVASKSSRRRLICLLTPPFHVCVPPRVCPQEEEATRQRGQVVRYQVTSLRPYHPLAPSPRPGSTLSCATSRPQRQNFIAEQKEELEQARTENERLNTEVTNRGGRGHDHSLVDHPHTSLPPRTRAHANEQVTSLKQILLSATRANMQPAPGAGESSKDPKDTAQLRQQLIEAEQRASKLHSENVALTQELQVRALFCFHPSPFSLPLTPRRVLLCAVFRSRTATT